MLLKLLESLVGRRGADDVCGEVRLLLNGSVRLEREKVFALGGQGASVEVRVNLGSKSCMISGIHEMRLKDGVEA